MQTDRWHVSVPWGGEVPDTTGAVRRTPEPFAADKERFGRWEGPVVGVGLGMAGALGTYLGWPARRLKRKPPR